MSYISEDTKKQIIEAGNIEAVVSHFISLKKSGASLVGKCQQCAKEKKLTVSKSKNIYKCFKCDKGGSPVDYLMNQQGKTYPEALQFIADQNNIPLADKRIKRAKSKPKAKGTSFMESQLASSGLTIEDVTFKVVLDDETKKEFNPYIAGTFDQKRQIISGDDMIMSYYDLEGKPMTYYQKDKNGSATGKPLELTRARWQNPNLKKDKHGRPIKYQSPYGSGSRVWIPKLVRNAYQQGRQFDTLYIQEGEKKADKASKHGMFSLGIMGIHNIANEKQLPHEFELIISKCGVKNVVFVLDADWDELGNNLSPTADTRPKSFARAIINFRDYFISFNQGDSPVEIYFATIKSEKDKGIDDILCNTLKGKEDSLLNAFKDGLTDINTKSEYINLFKITTVSTGKIWDIWHLNNVDSFAQHHKDRLSVEGEFKFGKVKWRYSQDGKNLELAQPLLDDEKFWDLSVLNSGKKQYNFNYYNCYTFLQNRGYSLLRLLNRSTKFIHIENKIIKEVDALSIRHFIQDFSKQINEIDVLNMLYKGGAQYFREDSLKNLALHTPTLHTSGKGFQYLYFNESFWHITESGIKEKTLIELDGQVWQEKIINAKPSSLDPFFRILEQASSDEEHSGQWFIELSEDAKQCHFFDFLYKCSNFYHRIDKPTEEQILETNKHLLNKMSTIGYLMHRYRDSGLQKAVVAMDGRMTEVGSSNGRSGKSLLGEAISKMIPTAYINGKQKNLEEDRFIWEEVDERTEVCFIDDVLTNFDFERFFPEITGSFQIEGKGVKKHTLPRDKSPKILITTNHAIKGDGSSFKDRQILLGFSDFFNEKRKPKDVYGVLFWDEWDAQQWNLFYNLMANCLQIYFKYGIIEAPTGNLLKRKLRQEMGEAFLEWAELYFEEYKLGKDINKKHAYNFDADSFISLNPTQERYVNIQKFKSKIKAYAKYKDYIFNPGRPDRDGNPDGGDNKSGGIEFIKMIKNDA